MDSLSTLSRGSLSFLFPLLNLRCPYVLEMAGLKRLAFKETGYCCSLISDAFFSQFLLSCLLHFSVLTCLRETLTNWNTWGMWGGAVPVE